MKAKRQHAVVIEDDASLRASLERELAGRGYEVTGCSSVSEALACLTSTSPALVVADVQLPDGDAVAVLEAVKELPVAPTFVAMSGAALPSQSFRLAQLGVRTYLTKPFDLGALHRAIDAALQSPVDLRPHLRGLVGAMPVHEVERSVRSTMVKEAMARANGKKGPAARLLKVSRQLLQHILRSLGSDEMPSGKP